MKQGIKNFIDKRLPEITGIIENCEDLKDKSNLIETISSDKINIKDIVTIGTYINLKRYSKDRDKYHELQKYLRICKNIVEMYQLGHIDYALEWRN